MPDTADNPIATTPPPVSPTGHPLPRRTSPDKSITLHHHQLARDASMRALAAKSPQKKSSGISSPRRNSSGDSHETNQSDPRNWFDQNNENPTATFDNTLMEVDPPFYQKHSESSNEDRQSAYEQHIPPRLTGAQSSSADDYRSVIDDLTVEIQKLKEELKRYKQKGPDMLRKEKLFEIKIHGLPKTKRRELEATLRDFTASLEGSPDASSSQRKKSSRHNTRDHLYSRADSGFKHASSSSGSNTRPADSAYASMSTGANSSGTSLGRPSVSSRSKSSEEKIEKYLRDIPEGLYPRSIALTDKERKRLVVRRLEQLFTGKMGGRMARRNQLASPRVPQLSQAPQAPAGVISESTTRPNDFTLHQPPALVAATGTEPNREARILPPEKQSSHSTKKSRSAGNESTSNSNGDNTDFGNGNSSGSGANTSPPMPPPPEQRPTRPTDLDPDRVQIPSENMDYIRHLGLVPPELIAETHKYQDVEPNAEGWVYLNLLCSLAQLHMINVTPNFVRAAVSDMSEKFQLSPDGRKIRWRGGIEGTRFSSDSSSNSHKSPDTEDTDASNKHERSKRQKTGHSTGDEFLTGTSSKNTSKVGAQASTRSDSFHYKPMFAHQDSLDTQRSSDDTSSSLDPAAEESHPGESGWGQSGSGQTNRRKRRHDGAIIYYSGAPFCTDLSGDPGDVSPLTYMQSSGQGQQNTYDSSEQPSRPSQSGSFSGSLLSRPLCEKSPFANSCSDGGLGGTDSSPNSGIDLDDYMDEDAWDFSWSKDEQQKPNIPTLEPCGLGGVMPEDHFTVVVSTLRPKFDDGSNNTSARITNLEEKIGNILDRSARSKPQNPLIECKYVSGRIKRLDPVPLPPPGMFFQNMSTETSSSLDDDLFVSTESAADDAKESEETLSRRVNPHLSDDYPDGVDLSSGDEDGEDLDDEADVRQIQSRAAHNMERELPDRRRTLSRAKSIRSNTSFGTRGRQKSATVESGLRARGSSAATAGAVKDGYSSSDEMNS